MTVAWALAHRHGLQRLQSQVLTEVVRCEQFLEDYDLIVGLAEPNQEVGVCRCGVDFVAEFNQSALGGLQPFRRGKGQPGGLVGRAEEIEFGRHTLFEFQSDRERRSSQSAGVLDGLPTNKVVYE